MSTIRKRIISSLVDFGAFVRRQPTFGNEKVWIGPDCGVFEKGAYKSIDYCL